MNPPLSKPKLVEFTKEKLVPLQETSFAQLGIRERKDLQRLLRTQIEVIEPGLYVLTEEFSDWQESQRRIDLLCIDSAANLVVVELKRTDDGGHMELQALRYAAMTSTMTFEQAVNVHQDFLDKHFPNTDAEKRLRNFLGWEEPRKAEFGRNVRIILASEDFSKEITATVLWLIGYKLDIRCVRLKPYTLDNRIVIDAQQIIPLPEASDYIIRVKEKEDSQRAGSAKQKSSKEIWAGFQQNWPADILALARELDEWADEQGCDPLPLTNDFARTLAVNGQTYYLFKFRHDRRLVFSFQYFATKPPFTQTPVRAALLERANAVPGLSVTEEELARRPNVPLQSFLDEGNKRQLKEFLSWVIDQVKLTDS